MAKRNRVSRRCDGVLGGTFLTPGMASVPEMAASAMTDAEVLKKYIIICKLYLYIGYIKTYNFIFVIL